MAAKKLQATAARITALPPSPQPSKIHSVVATMIALTVENTEYSISPRSKNGVSRPRRQCR
ncbi:hypothetical protein D3C84_1058920 [compost metagenome]